MISTKTSNELCLKNVLSIWLQLQPLRQLQHAFLTCSTDDGYEPFDIGFHLIMAGRKVARIQESEAKPDCKRPEVMSIFLA